MTICILNDHKRNGCKTCSMPCAHKIAIEGLNGNGGRVAAARVPSLYKGLTLRNSPVRADQSSIYTSLDNYVNTFEQLFHEGGERIKSLYLYSKNTGTGKTSTACALLNEFIIASYVNALKQGQKPSLTPAYFFDVNEWQELYNEFNRANIPADVGEAASREYYARMKKAIEADFVVMDDIGVRTATEAFRGDLHKVINARLNANKATVYTSNVELDQLELIFDKRVADRVRAYCKEHRFKGTSKRGLEYE